VVAAGGGVKSSPHANENFCVTTESRYQTEAKNALVRLAGKPLKNRESGMMALINTTQANKLISNAAVNKSMANSFTREQHYALVCMVEILWNGAIEVVHSPDKNNLPGISMKRFAVPVFVEEERQYAVMTVKATQQHGNRIYTLEAHTEKTLRGMLDKAKSETGSTLTPSRSVAAILEILQKKSISPLLNIGQSPSLP